MTSRVLCPFCRTSWWGVNGDWRSLFADEDGVERFECRCGATAFSSATLQQGVALGESDALERLRILIEARPGVRVETRWEWITETAPPQRLLWAWKRGTRWEPEGPRRRPRVPPRGRPRP